MTKDRPRTLIRLLAVLALTAAFFLVSYRHILTAPGHLFQNWDQTIPPYASQIEAYGRISSEAWTSIFEMGAPGAFTGIGWAFDSLMRRGLAFLGGETLARWHFLAYTLIGAAGFFRLCRRLGLGLWPTLAVCLVSQFNPRTYTLAVSGHGFETGFALMLVPWMVDCAESARRSPGWGLAGWSLAAGMCASLAFSSSPIGLALAAAFLAVWGLAACLAGRTPRPLAVLGLASAVVLATQAHWVLPAAGLGADGAKYNQRMEDVRAHYLHLYKDFSAPPRLAMIGHLDNLGMGTEHTYPVEGGYGRAWQVSAYALLGLALLGLTASTAGATLKAFAFLCLLGGFWMLAGVNTLPGRILYEGVLGKVSMVFYLMARPMRWLPLYQAGLALCLGLGLQAVADRGFWRSHRWPGLFAGAVCACALAVYLFPWWSGALSTPRNETTQTMSLVPQPLDPDESDLVREIHQAPGHWRVSVFPTVAGPTGDVPAPPATSLTRNFGLLGKDSLVGPAHVGQPLGRYLLSLAHRQAPATDAFGRLLGLGAVGLVLFDAKVAHLSYDDYGWMPQVKRGPETLSDPGRTLSRFLAAQRDLAFDPNLSRGPFVALDNGGELPRLRQVDGALLASGGFGLLTGLAELPANPFASAALFFGPDLDAAQARALAEAFGQAVVRDDETRRAAGPQTHDRPAVQPEAAASGVARAQTLEQPLARKHASGLAASPDASGTNTSSPGASEAAVARAALARRAAAPPGASCQVVQSGEDWPELVLPWLPPRSWLPAWPGAQTPPTGFKPLGEQWRRNLWLASSPLDGAGLVSQGPGALTLSLPEGGELRLLARVMSLPDGQGVRVVSGGRTLADTGPPSPLDRGWRWLDLGSLPPGPGRAVRFETDGPGACVSGLLAVPPSALDAALKALDEAFPAGNGTAVLAQAEALAAPGSRVYQEVHAVPLLGAGQEVQAELEGLRVDDRDGAGGGTLAAEGQHVAQALFTVSLPFEAGGFTLESFPRLFGDPGGLAFVRAEWSPDGREWLPLYDLAGRTDGKWEHVYDRREVQSVEHPGRTVRLRFTLRQAQLVSQAAPPNRPMRLLVSPARPFPGAASMGQAVLTPAAFSLKPMRPGSYRAWARMLTPEGPRWFPMGQRATGPDGRLDLSGGPSGAACDLFFMLAGPDMADGSSPGPSPGPSPGLVRPGAGFAFDAAPPAFPHTTPPLSDPAQAMPDPRAGDSALATSASADTLPTWPPAAARPPAPLDFQRRGQARWEVTKGLQPGGLLVFSESFHPRWQAGGLAPLKAYGSMNAYLLPSSPPETLEVLFTPQLRRELGQRLTLAAWGASLILCLLFLGLARFSSGRKQDRALPTS